MSDFIYIPDFVFDETIEYKTLISEFENGAEQRRRKWANPKGKWILKFNNRLKTELTAIKDFFKNKSGSFMSFTWTNPNDDTEYTVRFITDSFKFSRIAHDIYNFSFEFVEDK